AGGRSFVTVARMNGKEGITIPWKAYTPEGIAMDLVGSLTKDISSVRAQIKDVNERLENVDAQAGTIKLAKAVNTRPLVDVRQCHSYRGGQLVCCDQTSAVKEL